MKCPKCSNEMRNGFVMAPNGLFWENEMKKGKLFAAVGTDTLIPRFAISPKQVSSHRCDKCDLVLVEIPKNK